MFFQVPLGSLRRLGPTPSTVGSDTFNSFSSSQTCFTCYQRGKRNARDKKTVIFFTTGGTIAGVATSSTETKDYKPGVLDVGSLIKSVPGIEKVAKISGEQIANIDSSYITNDIWLKLANRVNELLLKKEIDGIVITHGQGSN